MSWDLGYGRSWTLMLTPLQFQWLLFPQPRSSSFAVHPCHFPNVDVWASATTEWCSGILNWNFWKGTGNPESWCFFTTYSLLVYLHPHTFASEIAEVAFAINHFTAGKCKMGEADFSFLSNHHDPFTCSQRSWQCSESVVPWPGSLLKDELVSYELPSSFDGIIELASQNALCIQAQVQAPHQVHKSPILKPREWAIAESNYACTVVKKSLLFLCPQQKDRMQRNSGELISKQISPSPSHRHHVTHVWWYGRS